MAMAAGSVTVASDLSRSGSGLALSLYDARRPNYDAIVNSNASLITSLDAVRDAATITKINATTLAALQGLATSCTQDATGIVPYIVANASVTVTIHTTDSGLQQTPNPNNPNTATLGPSTNKTVTGGTIS